MSDPHSKRWLADDPHFLASLDDLDRGLVDGEEFEEAAAVPVPPRSATTPVARRSTAIPGPPRSAAIPAPPRSTPIPSPPPSSAITSPPPSRAGSRAINAARALDPARVLETPLSVQTPPPSVRRPPLAPPAPIAPTAPDPFADPNAEPSAPAPLPFTRSAAPRPRRPLLDLFPPSALEPERPPSPALGMAVGPQLPAPRPRPTPPPADDVPLPIDALTYETFYGLREKPFSLSTDPRFLYQSAAFEHASQDVLAATRKRGGAVVLTAPLGMGKTMLCRSLVAEIDRRTVTSLVLEPLQSLDGLITTMLVDFGVIGRDDLAAASSLSREQLIGTLNQFLESLAPLQASAVLIIDEAQNVPIALLGDLAVLLGSPAAAAVQLVLVGQPALTSVLKHPELRGLNATVARRVELGPLAADEVAGYVMHRLSIAGANTRIEFDEPAIGRLFELSDGAPRIVNVLCDRAMSRGQAASAAVIDAALIDAAAEDLDLEPPAGERPGLVTALLIVALFALLTIAGAAGALWVYRDAVTRTIQQWESVPQAPGGPVRRLPVPLAPIPPPLD